MMFDQRDPARRTEVRFRAGPAHLFVVRTVARAVAAMAGLEADAVADLKIAVDEACTLLVERAVEGACVVCRYQAEDCAVLFGAVVRSDSGRMPDPHSLFWQVITAMTDAVTTWVEPFGRDYLLHIEFRLRGALST